MFSTIENFINHLLSLDPESKKRLQPLENKIITIECIGLVTLQLVFIPERVEIKLDELIKPNTVIKGTPLSLLHLMLKRNDRKRFFTEQISIEGEVELGQDVIDLFDHLEIDWEEYLSRWITDAPAHQIGRFARSIKATSQRLRQSFSQNINEYVHEEINYFPPPEALQDFYAEIDALRMDTDRLEARIDQLMNHLKEV